MSSAPQMAPVTSLTEDEVMLQDIVRKFAVEQMQPKVRQMDEQSAMDPQILQGLFDNGLMGVEIDEQYGGSASSFTGSCLVVEELARIDPAVSIVADIQNTLINRIFGTYANEELRAKYLPRLATDTIASFCLSEQGSGSDAFAMRTKAEKVGNKFVLNGTKMWISQAREADVFLVFANADPAQGYKGITCFAVDKSMGVRVGKAEDKLGIRASSTCEVIFENVEVPEENVVGEFGKGYKIAIECLNEGRIGIAAQMVGLAQGAYDAAMPYMIERKQFGSALSDFQGMQHQYAQAATEIAAARVLTYNAARMKESGESVVESGAMAKLYASQVAERTASKCVEWLGGVGFTKDFPVEKFYRDCKIGAIYEGTSNIQLQTIAKLVKAKYQ